MLSSPLGSAYPVSLPAFEGPLDLLLQLIERNELEISAISLVAVTDQYLRTVERMEEVDPGALADFLVVASRLVYIKSRALLPQPRPAGEQLDEEEEPADALVRQLLEYRRFKEVAAHLRSREERGLRVYVRVAAAPELERRLDLGALSLEQLHAALRKVLARVPKDPPIPRVKTYSITVAEQIEAVRAAVLTARQQSGGLRFVDLLSAQTSRLEVIVTFLAVLELIKQQELVAIQEGTFGEIQLVPTLPEQA
jgi:segregation and condensation protein A